MKIAVFLCFVVWMISVADSKKSHVLDAAHDVKTGETECNDHDAEMVNCKNGGTCFKLKIDDEKTGFTCHCPSGYSGPYCDQGSSQGDKLSKKWSDLTEDPVDDKEQRETECNDDDAEMVNCKNGGTCFKLKIDDEKTGFTCHCPSGYSGPHCEQDDEERETETDDADDEETKEKECNDDEAEMINCKHGGTCFKLNFGNGKTGFSCHCPSGFSGPRCVNKE